MTEELLKLISSDTKRQCVIAMGNHVYAATLYLLSKIYVICLFVDAVLHNENKSKNDTTRDSSSGLHWTSAEGIHITMLHLPCSYVLLKHYVIVTFIKFILNVETV